MPNTAKKHEFAISDRVIKKIQASKQPVRVEHEAGDVILLKATDFEKLQEQATELDLLNQLAIGEKDITAGKIHDFDEVKKIILSDYEK